MTSVGVIFINRDVGKYVKIHDVTMYIILSNIQVNSPALMQGREKK